MKLGDVFRKEREARDASVEGIATRLGLAIPDYRQLELGESAAERWGPILAQIAIELETPTSRLLAGTGRSEDTRPGQAGALIQAQRKKRGRSRREMAEALGITVEQYDEIELGGSDLETFGPLFLRFAEAVDQPVFNLFFPCGLPFQELDDYP